MEHLGCLVYYCVQSWLNQSTASCTQGVLKRMACLQYVPILQLGFCRYLRNIADFDHFFLIFLQFLFMEICLKDRRQLNLVDLFNL